MRKIVIGLLICFVLISFTSCSKVDTNERGVLTRMGEIRGDVLQPGLKWHMPILYSVKTYSITPTGTRIQISIGEDSIISKDNQDIGATVDVYWKYDENRIIEVASNYNKDSLNTIVVSVTKNAIKTVMGRYDVYSLAENQQEINDGIKAYIINQTDQYPIVITDVRLVNIDWSPAFTKSIEETMQVTQQIKIANQEKQIKEIESQSQVIEAEAVKKAALLKAEAEKETALLKAEAEYEVAVKKAEAEKEQARLAAEAKVLEGNAIKEYNEAIQANIETELKLRELENEKLRIEQWDGKYVPTNNYGPIPISSGSIQGI